MQPNDMMLPYINQDTWIAVFAALGLFIGSFLNVVIHRLPRMLEREWHTQCAELGNITNMFNESGAYNLALPASSCPHCGHRIRWYENIPILSYIALKGRCSACKQPIFWRYPLVEAISGLLTGYAIWHFGLSIQALAAIALLWALIALTFIDIERQLLPDNITQPLLWGGLLINLYGIFVPLEDALLGAVAGYLTFWLIHHIFLLVTGKEGIGQGDFKLLAALGAWLGWQMLPLIVILSSLFSAMAAIFLITFAGHSRAQAIPFGPWLALSGLISLFYGDVLNKYFWL